MKKQDPKEKLFDLINNNLSPEDREGVISALEKSGIGREEIESIISVSRLVEDAPSPEPPDRMDKRFYAMLEDEKRKAILGEPEIKVHRSLFHSWIAPGLKIAAGITLFLLGWFNSVWFGPSSAASGQLANLSGEVRELKETLVLTMMQQSSPVERIKAVNMVGEFDKVDDQVIESLIHILNYDGNDNVRLLSLDALIRYSSVPKVREGLIASIGNQTSPMVQLRFAEIMLALNEKRAVPEFQKILRNASLNYNVRGRINEAVVVLL
jgi:hypothetical protein